MARYGDRSSWWAWLAFSCASAFLCHAGYASAYCRTTTCNESISCTDDSARCCDLDAQNCDQNGTPIYWPSGCVSYTVHEAGSSRSAISADQFAGALENVFSHWLDSPCDASIQVSNYGFSSCGRPTVNESTRYGNTNEWMFVDEGWDASDAEGIPLEIDASRLALTTVTYDPETGAIFDADVEINSEQFAFALEPNESSWDLEGLLAHEAGHFFGLADTVDSETTMYHRLRTGDLSHRELSDDDRAGFCAIYPSDRALAGSSCEPENGFSPECQAKVQAGCSMSQSVAKSKLRDSLQLALFAAFALALATRRWRLRDCK